MPSEQNAVSLYPGRDSNSYNCRQLEDFEAPGYVQHHQTIDGFHDAQVARATPTAPARSGAFQRTNPESIPSLAADHYTRSVRTGWHP